MLELFLYKNGRADCMKYDNYLPSEDCCEVAELLFMLENVKKYDYDWVQLVYVDGNKDFIWSCELR